MAGKSTMEAQSLKSQLLFSKEQELDVLFYCWDNHELGEYNAGRLQMRWIKESSDRRWRNVLVKYSVLPLTRATNVRGLSEWLPSLMMVVLTFLNISICGMQH
jgi:hypothetical protein